MIALSASDPSLGALAFRLLGSLAVVVGLLLLIARGVNRRFKAPAGAAIQVVHRRALGRGQSVAVVSVGTRVLVLGTTEQQVTLLTEVEPDEVGLDVLDDGGLGPVPSDDENDDQDEDRRPARTAPAPAGPLAGSVLSAQTWKQTLAAVTGKRAS
ncbi:flagellar biosynthetic protein FliO [Nocardioides sp. W3-2-3]|uniref:flagellar biosynthetic protein FliO n=1 Tax=Nocardioides convexus TaxID=2712224 RepID=UPI0024185CDD|nr:flagellar biosynthetic protein FliO [Nocardioides convexus]NHA00584.1 flagellar biosynthetic protein FliO [Nocardioides convexus]